MTRDGFGLKREISIANSKVREIFTPFAPIDVIDHFFGREEEVEQLVGVVNSPGQHVLLYGDRGVGKTSLATITCNLISRAGVSRGRLFDKRCDSSDSFASVVREPLRYVGVDFELSEVTRAQTGGGEAKLKGPFVEGGVGGKHTKTTKRVPFSNIDSPSWVAKRLSGLKGVFLVDEVDALTRKGDRKKLAELIKLLSDMKSDFKLMVVGIAETGQELTAGHPSVERCLKETHLSRMADDDLRKIVERGMQKLKLACDADVVGTIVEISAGYPHFTHLICLKCAGNAIASGKRWVTIGDLPDALRDAVKESEGVLKRRYEHTIRGTKHEAEYVNVLHAAAECALPEFRLATLQKELEQRLGVHIARKVLSRYMSAMIVNGRKGVFVRVSTGVFRFSDPRMPSLIKMMASQSAGKS